MAFTIMQGTILKSLFAFNIELEHLAQQAKYAKQQNGVVIATIDGHSLTYHKTEPGTGKPGETVPISRTVVVTAKEDGELRIHLNHENNDVASVFALKYPFITAMNDTILNFLLHGQISH